VSKRDSKKLHALITPTAGSRAWVDALLLLIFGSWFLSGIYVQLFVATDPYPCSGPGPVDFGCTGGTDALISNALTILFMIFLFIVSAVALARLINRFKHNKVK
jgi:hypothetical protein